MIRRYALFFFSIFFASAAFAADGLILFPNISVQSYLGASLKFDTASLKSYGIVHTDVSLIEVGSSFDLLSSIDKNFSFGGNFFAGLDFGFFERHHLALTLYSQTRTFETTAFSSTLRASLLYQFYFVPSFNVGFGTGFGTMFLYGSESFNHGQDTLVLNTQAYSVSLLVSAEYIFMRHHGFSVLFNMANAMKPTQSIAQFYTFRSSGIIEGESGYTYYPRTGVDLHMKPIYSFSVLYRYLF